MVSAQSKAYCCSIIKISPVLCITLFFLMLALGFVEGVGIFLIIPLLQLSGVQTGIALPSGLQFLSENSLSLIVVLLVYAIILNAFAFLRYQRSMLAATLRESCVSHWRKRLYAGLLRAQYGCLAQKKETEVLHAITTETSLLGVSVQQGLDCLTSSLLVAVYGLFFFCIAPIATLISATFSVVLFVLLRHFHKKTYQAGQFSQAALRGLYESIHDFFRCLKFSKTHGLQVQQLQQFTRFSESIAQTQLAFAKANNQTGFLYEASSAIFVSLIFYVALSFLNFSMPALLLLLVVFSRLLIKVSGLTRSYQTFLNLFPSFQAIWCLERDLLQHQEPLPSERAILFQEEIMLARAGFFYEDRCVFQQLTLSLKKNTLTLLIGPNGSGKSTIADILSGLLLLTHGLFLIDGKPLTDPVSWRRKLLYVSQQALLSQVSIRENCCMVNPDATDDAIWRALEIVGVASVIRALPDGLSTRVGTVQFSGGECQKINLSRVLLCHPEFLILDEASNAMDASSRLSFFHFLATQKSQMTILVITHEPHELYEIADQVLELKMGVLSVKKSLEESLEG